VINGRVSVVIPGCNEGFMQATIDSLLTSARGDVEIIAVVDGGPVPNLKHDPRVRVVLNGQSLGMRPCTNAAAEIATGQFLMKADAHCIFGPGWDVILKGHCEENWLAVPTRHSIDGEAWKADPAAGAKAVKWRDYNYHYLTWPFDLSMYGYGLHAKTFDYRENRVVNERWKDKPVDDLMSFQGSCWFMHLKEFKRLGPLDHANYYFYQEAQEVGLRQWMSGGRCVIVKDTWYAHYHKGKNALHTLDGREGRGFFLNVYRKRDSEKFATDFWLNDRWPGATMTFLQFVERFSDLLGHVQGGDRWPEDWHDFAKHKAAFESRPAEAIPAHT
jgi:glycosyltransferase involved in cell wall biosynthesis